MTAKQMAAEIKRVGLLRAGNLQDELNALAIKLEDEVTDLRTKNSALQLSQDNIINGLGITGDGPVSKSVIEYVLGLVAENSSLKASQGEIYDYTQQFANSNDREMWNAMHDIYKLSSPLETPATDAAIVEIKAQGLEQLASACEESASDEDCSCNHASSLRVTKERAERFALFLRAGRKG